MLKSLQVEVGSDVILLWEAISKTRVTVRANSSGVKVGDKELTWDSGLSLTVNVARDIELQKGDNLYAMSSGDKVVQILIQQED